MIETIVKQFLSSGAGGDILKQLQGQGLDTTKATSAVSATAEGAMAQLGGAGGIAGMAAGALGIGGGSGGAPNLSAMIAPVAQFVAQKTGISPAIAQTVVNAVLPKIIGLLPGAAGAPPQAESGGLGGMLKGLFK
ncbi:MAG: hypothetical protein ACKVPX_06530 [Myxococcaceae bacterium]